MSALTLALTWGCGLCSYHLKLQYKCTKKLPAMCRQLFRMPGVSASNETIAEAALIVFYRRARASRESGNLDIN